LTGTKKEEKSYMTVTMITVFMRVVTIRGGKRAVKLGLDNLRVGP